MVQFIIFSIKVVIQGIQNFRGIYCGDFKPGVDLRVIINGDLNPLVQSVILFERSKNSRTKQNTIWRQIVRRTNAEKKP